MKPLGMLCLVALLQGAVPPATAAKPPKPAALFPLDAVSATNRPLVEAVLAHHTLRRDYPARSILARRDQLEFLFDHLEACSVLAQAAGLIRYRATRDREDRIWADDHEGARGYLTLVVARPGQRVYYVEGTQQGLWEARGRGLAVVTYRATAPKTIEYRAVALIKVDNAVLAFLAQLFRVFLKGAVDNNFERVMNNPIVLSGQAVRAPDQLRKLIDGMSPEDQVLLGPFRALLDAD